MSKIGNFDIFEDRVHSLLERWQKYRNVHENDKDIDAICVAGFINEINDDLSIMLMERTRK